MLRELVLEAARDGGSADGHKQSTGPASVESLRRALDDAVAAGRPIPYDKPLVTRLV